MGVPDLTNRDFISDNITDHGSQLYGLITNNEQFFGLVTNHGLNFEPITLLESNNGSRQNLLPPCY